MARRQTSSVQLVRRVQILLQIAQGKNNQQVGREMGTHRETVRQWRKRWLSARERLSVVEATADDKQLMQLIESLLADEPRPGTPTHFSLEQIAFDFGARVRETGCFWLFLQSLDVPSAESRGHQKRDCRTNFGAPSGAFFKRKQHYNRTGIAIGSTLTPMTQLYSRRKLK